MQLINDFRQTVRSFMKKIALGINKYSKGRISPNNITLVGLAAHLPISLLIASDHLLLAALLLVIFGLFDTLDGELARLQSKASSAGMLLDASTDRIKEVLLYTGAAYYISMSAESNWTFIAVLACGASLSVSYIKAKGESAIATSGTKIDQSTLNRIFSDGLATFEVRMFMLAIGLIANQLTLILLAISILSSYTAAYRLLKISKYLSQYDKN